MPLPTILYLIWDGRPEMFSIGSFSLRWYGLLFAGGFLISQQILYYFFKKEGKPQADVDTITIYMVVATLIGARLGHVIFYQPDMLWNDPLGVFLPVEFSPEFRFVGLRGLASHGGAIGILVAMWVYSRKKKPGQNYLQILDRIVIVVALTGAMIRLGNFFNSEIIGKPTDAPTGVVFAGVVLDLIREDQTQPNIMESVRVERHTQATSSDSTRKPIRFYVRYRDGVTPEQASRYAQSVAGFYLAHMGSYVELPPGALQYEVHTVADGRLEARINALGIARHPSQLYEMASSFLLFLLLFYIWSRKKEHTPTGLIFGVFMVVLWGARFFYEFSKENQVAFEDALSFNMGQILSIPLFICGVVMLILVYRGKIDPPPQKT